MAELEDKEQQALSTFSIARYQQGKSFPVDDVVAREEPLEIRLNGRSLVYLMRLPGDDILLAAGFCLSEGLIGERKQIELIQQCVQGEFAGMASSIAGDRANPVPGVADPGNLVEIKAKLLEGADRFVVARVVRTGCGGADLDREVDLSGVKVESDVIFSTEVVQSAPDALLAGQEIFKASGGTHGAGLFDRHGRMLVVKEDVGRHNAVDKALGFLLMSQESPTDKGLILSGRLSYEMVLKAARAGVPLVCSVSAPTALGIEVGVRTGVTTVGFLRGAGFNVYSHPARVGGS
ncbi:MAG: sulfurtransferase FdhD [Candidatus Anoxymicrobium japonicum]|uniref:Sulfur carrier protein FdhD n=1 Tax=Candidatus Anoxymicrobium japonicum TaxID=2013648 RepID=A0A2N3G2A0_9ACTN|nr:MAG: sulfurtransferase FdhD [Candidatus Anoxymicrobium japonicum]